MKEAKVIWESKRLDCWQKFKELRINGYQDVMEAREKGKLLISGSAGGFHELLAGLGPHEYLAAEPYGATLGTFPDLARECCEATEERGYARDLCSYMRAYWGSVFLNKSPWGHFPRPDFVFTEHNCDSRGKWFQVVSEYLNIPYFFIETPRSDWDLGTVQSIQYLVDQCNEFIEWAEKVTGRPYDDEAFIQAVINSRKAQVLWAQICELNKAIPAPLDCKSLYTLYVPAVYFRYRPESVEIYTTLKEEVEDRVKKGIAAVATERCRFIHDNIPPWHALRILRYMEKYGGVGIGSLYIFNWGVFGNREDGTRGSLKTWEELGRVPQTRDDALRLLAEHNQRDGSGFSTESEVEQNIWLATEWKCDAAIFHLNRGCEGVSCGQMQARLGLQRRLGLPTLVYEGNNVDTREWNEVEVLDRLDSFFEGQLGLKKVD